jgi:hypothetical protein
MRASVLARLGQAADSLGLKYFRHNAAPALEGEKFQA